MMGAKTTNMTFYTAGGRIPMGLLRDLAEAGMVHGNGTVALGSRQELTLPAVRKETLGRVRHIVGDRMPEYHPKHPNIVTTRPACAGSTRTAWLGEGGYDRVLNAYQSPPGIAVDLVDPVQTWMPLFMGDIHLVATPEPDYWMLYLNDSTCQERIALASGIHSDDIAQVTSLIQQAVARSGHPDLKAIRDEVELVLGNRLKNLDGLALSYPIPNQALVGFVPDDSGKRVSLGIPLQSTTLPGAFLVELAVIAERCGIATAHVTPWKSLIVHGIPRDARVAVEKLLVRHRVNLAPGVWNYVCLNGWDGTPAASDAIQLLEALNRRIPHTGGLSLGLVGPRGAFPDTPIIVRDDTTRAGFSRFSPRQRYSIFSRENFERHNPTLVSHGKNIASKDLATHVIALIDAFGAAESNTRPAPVRIEKPVAAGTHQCGDCGTEYSELYGDPLGEIPVGTPFADLPDSWVCPTCAAPLKAFVSAA